MLLNMHIKNIALIDDIDINFYEGLNILTGETGAGKSIIIGSLGICLGGKFQKDLLRDETKDGLVELIFLVNDENIKNQLAAIDIFTDEEDQLLISRRTNAAGRTINRINDNTVTIGKLKEVSDILIDLHAQHEQQTLLKPAKHLEILDRFGGDELENVKGQVLELYQEYITIKNKLEEDTIDENEKNKQIDFLKYQIDEINSANLKAGEDEELEVIYRKIVNSKEILSTAGDIYKLTGYGNGSSASEQIGHALMNMKRIVDLDSDLQGSYEILQDIDGMISDFNRELNQYMDAMEFDAEEFTHIESKLDLINGLKAKYGKNIDEVLAARDTYEIELEKLISYEEYIGKLKAGFQKVSNKLEEKSNELTKIRKNTAVNMCKLIKEALEELNFMSVEFDMRFSKLDKYSANGNDEALFYISTNVGEDMRPLNQVASGGELSRVMLALKSCIANLDDTPTLVFDEIDVGISGRTAQKVAERMSVIADKHQVICITHLPQIASMADYHYIIEKNVENNKTITNIRKLSEDEEVDEIARLLGGAEITEATLASAREMKGLAKSTKKY